MSLKPAYNNTGGYFLLNYSWSKQIFLAGLQHDDFHNQQPSGLPLSESLLPNRLRELGYTAHGVGKVR